MEPSPNELPKSGAIIRLASGKVLVGHGPFTEQSEPPSDKTAFYVNTFDLADPHPWKIPAHVSAISGALPSHSPVEMTWEPLSPKPFARVFDEMKQFIDEGSMEKAVPVLAESGTCLHCPSHHLAQLCLQAPLYLHAYGFWNESTGFCGATPELLFSLTHTELRTMALAGTATSDSEATFIRDPKEIREHELVVSALQEILSPLGQLTCSNRHVLHVGEIIHLLTNVSLTPHQAISPNEWIHLLHPTPALGIKPKSPELLKQLMEWRQQLDCPAHFGAPFGVLHEGQLNVLVAIRSIHWNHQHVKLAAGCGIVHESILEHEWDELALKRRSILQSLGILYSSSAL
jgi:menaquinone-specific isochorismate synthase